MTSSEAIAEVTVALGSLCLALEGEGLLPEEAGACVWEVVGEEWDKNLEEFCLGKKSPEEYVRDAMPLIDKFRVHRVMQRTEKSLLNARQKG